MVSGSGGLREGVCGLVDGRADQNCWVPIARSNGLTKAGWYLGQRFV